MNKRLLLWVLTIGSFVCGKQIIAQPKSGIKITVKGKVLDANSNNPLEFATISIQSKRDSSIIGGAITAEDGSFSIVTKPRPAFSKIEYLGFNPLMIDIPLKKNQPVIDLGTIYLEMNTAVIEGVEIVADKSETIFKLDKKVFNVGKDLSNRGGTAEELLDNVPSVAVDIDGNVNLRGNENVKILLNGQPSAMLSAGNANALRQIPASNIEKVEVITNPSANYEASGTAGIINIILKKETKQGFNGAINAGAGYAFAPDNTQFENILPFQYNVGGQLNYRKGKVNLFTIYSIGKNVNLGGGKEESFRDVADTTFTTLLNRSMNRGGLNNSITLGLDYDISAKQTVTFSGAYSNSFDDNEGIIDYTDRAIYNSNDYLINRNRRNDIENEDEQNQDYSIRYKNELGGEDHYLKGSLTFSQSIETENSDIYNDLQLPFDRDSLIQQSENTEGQTRWINQFDFSKPFDGNQKIEIGSFVSLRNISNDFKVGDVTQDGYIPLTDFTNVFDYYENIYAGYMAYSKEWNQFSAKVGLRTEYSNITTEFENQTKYTPIDTSYLNFFPSAFFNYKINEGNTIQVNYSRRIERPRFWYLNPFFTFADNRNFISGNPSLRPEYNHTMELNHLLYFEKGTLSSGLYYKYFTDIIQRIRTVNDDGFTTTSPVNSGVQHNIGLEVSVNYDVNKKLRLNGNFNIFRYNTISDLATTDISDVTTIGSVGAKLRFWKNADLQLKYNYRGPRELIGSRREGIGFLNAGLSKDFLKNNLTVTLSSNDIFNTRKRVYTYFDTDYEANGEFRRRGSSINLGISYRINQKKKRGGKKGPGSSGGSEY